MFKNTQMIIFQAILLGSMSVLFTFHNPYRLTLTIKTEMKSNFISCVKKKNRLFILTQGQLTNPRSPPYTNFLKWMTYEYWRILNLTDF